ncbi:MAG: WD40 repeat domain-containing protein [Pseudomonadota bacterium]
MPGITNVEAGEYVEWCGFVGMAPVFALADGSVVNPDGGEVRTRLHDGLTTAAIARDRSFLATGGEDGKIYKFRPNGNIEELCGQSSKWVDELACGPSGTVAAAVARQVTVYGNDGVLREIGCERTVEALAFAPKGMRLAMARYNGIELIWINTDQGSQFLGWDGAHIGVIFSPDGRYVVSSMQENAMHGWRLSDDRHMRMSGYPSKVKSMSFTRNGKWLASSGSTAAIVWPFAGKDGPMGKAPVELGSMDPVKVCVVACHPQEDVVAIGYENGMVGAARIIDGKLAILRREAESSITSLGWADNGLLVAFGTEAGEAGIIDITA